MMLPHIWSSITGLFSLTGLLGVIVGSGGTRLAYWIGDRIADRREPGVPHRTYFNNIVALWMLLFAVMGYIGFQQQQFADGLRDLVANTQECSREFNTAIRTSRKITDESNQLAKQGDAASDVQRDAIATWLHQIVQPPPDIAAIRANDPDFGTNPHYVRWSIDITATFEQTYNDARQQQIGLLKQREDVERRRPPYPEPTCGQS